MRKCSSPDVNSLRVVQPWVPSVKKEGTPEPESSQPEDLGARGGQAQPLLLPASRNLSGRGRCARERTWREFIECMV